MKKIISATLAILVTVGLLSGCTQDNTEDVSRISELEAQVGSLEDSMSALESEKEALAAACEDEKSRLESTLADAESKQEELIGENDKLKEELESLEQKYKVPHISVSSVYTSLSMRYMLNDKYYYALYSLINSTDDYRYTLNMIYKGDNGIENVIIHKDYQPIYNMAISPNGKTLVFTNFEMEGYAATFLYDIETGEKQELSLTDALPLNHAAFAYCWLDDRYLLMAEKLDHGFVAVYFEDFAQPHRTVAGGYFHKFVVFDPLDALDEHQRSDYLSYRLIFFQHVPPHKLTSAFISSVICFSISSKRLVCLSGIYLHLPIASRLLIASRSSRSAPFSKALFDRE